MEKLFNKKLKKLRGFTLVELLVAVTIFLTTVIFLSQIFISTLKLESVAYSMLMAENNVRNIIDSMARVIRMGKEFNSEDENNKINFKYYDSEAKDYIPISYRVITTGLEGSKNVMLSKKGQDIGELFNPEIQLKDAKFFIVKNNNLLQPTIIIVIKTETKIRGLEEPFIFNIQTAVTPRYLNF